MTVRLGSTVVIVASSSSTAREIFQQHNASLSGRAPHDAWRAGNHKDNSIFVLPQGHKWRALRGLGTEHLLSPRRLQELLPLRQDVVRDLLRDVSEQAASGVPVSVGRSASAAMVSYIWRAMFSAEPDDEVMFQEARDCVREGTVLIGASNVSDFFPVVVSADLQGIRRRTARLMARVYKLMNRQIERRICAREDGGGDARTNDLLDAMLDISEKEQEGSGFTVNRDLMRAFFTDLFVAGIDTTSSTIEWATAELLQNPQTTRKLQELESVLGSRTQVEDSDIGKLPYLQAVIKETLRLHSITPLLQYRADHTVEVQGYTIPKGISVVVNMWAIHHNAEVWTEPLKFIPERFLQKENDFSGWNFEFFPFGSGRHACLGLPLANRMLHVILGSLLHQFEWTLTQESRRDGVDMTEKFGLVLSMATPIHAVAKKK